MKKPILLITVILTFGCSKSNPSVSSQPSSPPPAKPAPPSAPAPSTGSAQSFSFQDPQSHQPMRAHVAETIGGQVIVIESTPSQISLTLRRTLFSANLAFIGKPGEYRQGCQTQKAAPSNDILSAEAGWFKVDHADWDPSTASAALEAARLSGFPQATVETLLTSVHRSYDLVVLPGPLSSSAKIDPAVATRQLSNIILGLNPAMANGPMSIALFCDILNGDVKVIFGSADGKSVQSIPIQILDGVD